MFPWERAGPPSSVHYGKARVHSTAPSATERVPYSVDRNAAPDYTTSTHAALKHEQQSRYERQERIRRRRQQEREQRTRKEFETMVRTSGYSNFDKRALDTPVGSHMIASLGKQLVAGSRITDSQIKQAQRAIQEARRQERDRQLRQELYMDAPDLAPSSSDSKPPPPQPVPSALPAVAQAQPGPPRSASQAGKRNVGLPLDAAADSVAPPPRAKSAVPQSTSQQSFGVRHGPFHDEYDALAWAQRQAQERAELAVREHSRAVKMKTRTALESQMEQRAKRRQQLQQQKRAEREALDREARKLEEEERAKARAKREKQQRNRVMYATQAEKARSLRRRSAEARAREERELLRQAQEKDMHEAQQRRQAALQMKDKLNRDVQKNVEHQKRKELQKRRAREEELKLLEEQRVMEERKEQRRELDRQRRLARVQQMKKQSGPSAYEMQKKRDRQRDLAMAKEMEQRAHEQEMREKRRAQRRRERERERMKAIDAQVAAKQRRKAMERKQAKEELKRLEKDSALATEMERRKRQQERQRHQAYADALDRQTQQMKQYRAQQSQMSAREKKMHGQYMQRFLDPKGASSLLGSNKRVDDDDHMRATHRRERLAVDPSDQAHLMSSTGLSLSVSSHEPSYNSPTKSPFGSAARNMF